VAMSEFLSCFLPPQAMSDDRRDGTVKRGFHIAECPPARRLSLSRGWDRS
jgi:hypothetical protein